MALNSKVVGQTVRKMFNVDGKAKGQSPVNKALFKTVDTRVRGGLINGWPTQEIADLMATDVVAAGVPGVNLTAPIAKQIRGQAMAIARTATQDMQRQVKEQLYEENKKSAGRDGVDVVRFRPGLENVRDMRTARSAEVGARRQQQARLADSSELPV